MLLLSNEIKGRVIELINQPFANTNKTLLMSLHREVFSLQYCVTCRSEQILAYIELTRLIRPKKMKSTKYKFSSKHKDSKICIPKKRWVVTADTLTDEQAKYLMASGGSFAGLIVEVKENNAGVKDVHVAKVSDLSAPKKKPTPKD